MTARVSQKKMKKKIVIFLLLIAGGLFFVSPVFAYNPSCDNLLIDNEKITGWGTVWGGDTYNNRGQTITPDNSYDTITAISFYLQGGNEGSCAYSIYDFTDDVRGGLLATTAFDCTTISGYGLTKKVLDTPLVLSGQKKLLLIPFSSQQQPYIWFNDPIGGYDYGDATINDIPYGTDDLAFQVYGCMSATPLPEQIIASGTDIEHIVGTLTTGSTTSYFNIKIPAILYFYLVSIFCICLSVMSLFFNHYGQYHNKKNKF